MDIFGIDATVAGLKRGAERFGTRVAAVVVKRFSVRKNASIMSRSQLEKAANGFSPKEPEPYGAGVDGAQTEQEMRENAEPAKDRDGTHGYIGLYKGKQYEVYADSSYGAQKKLAAQLGAKRESDVSVNLAEKDVNKETGKGTQVTTHLDNSEHREEPYWSWLDTHKDAQARDLKSEFQMSIEDAKYILESWKRASTENRNADSASLGFDSAQKTTTAQPCKKKLTNFDKGSDTCEHCGYYGYSREDGTCPKCDKARKNASPEMVSKCQACGHESPNEWSGKCEGCGVENESDMGSKAITKDDVVKENGSQMAEAARAATLSGIAPNKIMYSMKEKFPGASEGELRSAVSAAYKEIKGDPSHVKENDDMGSATVTKDDVIKENAPTFRVEETEDGMYEVKFGSGRAGEIFEKEKEANARAKDLNFGRQNSMENAGHLSAENWLSASMDERGGWLLAASQSIELASSDYADLSLDVKKALQDAWDMPASQNDKYAAAAPAEAPQEHDKGELVEPLLANASGKRDKQKFTFKDANGERHSVYAFDEAAAWQQLSDDFATSLEDVKGMGIKLESVKENASDAGTMREAIVHRYGDELRSGNLSGACKAALMDLAKSAGMDLQGVLKDLKGDAKLQNAKRDTSCPSCKLPMMMRPSDSPVDGDQYRCGNRQCTEFRTASGAPSEKFRKMNASEHTCSHGDLKSQESCPRCKEIDEELARRDAGRKNGLAPATNRKCPTCSGPVEPQEGISGSNSTYSCKRCGESYDSSELTNSDPTADVDQIESLAEGILHEAEEIEAEQGLENKKISESEIGKEIAHHERDKGMDPEQAIAAAYSETRQNSGVDRGSKKYGRDR